MYKAAANQQERHSENEIAKIGGGRGLFNNKDETWQTMPNIVCPFNSALKSSNVNF